MVKFESLEMLFIDNCQEISQESYKISPFKQHKHLKLLCVAHNREALYVHCVVELLKYTNSKVLLDIRGHYFTQEDFDYITWEHYNTQDRTTGIEPKKLAIINI